MKYDFLVPFDAFFFASISYVASVGYIFDPHYFPQDKALLFGNTDPIYNDQSGAIPAKLQAAEYLHKQRVLERNRRNSGSDAFDRARYRYLYRAKI